MADAIPNERLRDYLRELKPQARALLATELERAQLRGDSPAGASFILEALHTDARRDGRKLPRLGTPQRLFFVPLEPFLVDDALERKHRGRIQRVCLDPIWTWISRDLMPREAKTYIDEVNLLLAAHDKNGAEQIAGAFQDLAELRVRECLGALKADDKAIRKLAGQIGTPHAIEEIRDFAAVLRARDALGKVGSRLPPIISNLADAQLENVKALLESPIGGQRDVFLYAMLVVMSRLGSPWQLIRLAIHAASSDIAVRVAETPFSVAVDVVLDDIDRMIGNLRDSLRAGRSGEVAGLLKDIHDAARALHTEMDLSVDSPWGSQLAASRSEVASLLEAEIDNLPGQVRRLLRPRAARETHPDTVLDAGDVAEIEAKLVLATTCRHYAGELAISEATRRVHSDLQKYFDNWMQILLDRLRASPPAERIFRQSQVDAAVKFCAKVFGDEYAALLAKAADVAARGERKALKA